MAFTDKTKTFCSIIELIESGLSLRKALAFDDMPSRDTFFRWIKEDDKLPKEEKAGLSDQYARGMETRSDLIFEDILNIADGNGQDVRMVDDKTGTVEHDVINRARLRVDARKWVLGKMQPKKYGDYQKIDMDVTEVKPIITKRQD